MTMSSIIFKTRKITFILFIVILFSAAFAFAQKPSFEVVPSSGPTIQNTTMPITSGAQGTKFTITTKVSDISGVASVIAHIQKPDETDVAVITLYDDGSHNDGAAGDGIYGNILDSTGKSAGVYFVDIIAKDRLGYSAQEENGASFSITSATTTTTTTTTTTVPSTTTTTIPSTTLQLRFLLLQQPQLFLLRLQLRFLLLPQRQLFHVFLLVPLVLAVAQLP